MCHRGLIQQPGTLFGPINEFCQRLLRLPITAGRGGKRVEKRISLPEETTMEQRQIVRIDQEKCDGRGMCVPSCAEGAIQIVDGKAQLLADKFCDGLGACLGECPQGR